MSKFTEASRRLSYQHRLANSRDSDLRGWLAAVERHIYLWETSGFKTEEERNVYEINMSNRQAILNEMAWRERDRDTPFR